MFNNEDIYLQVSYVLLKQYQNKRCIYCWIYEQKITIFYNSFNVRYRNTKLTLEQNWVNEQQDILGSSTAEKGLKRTYIVPQLQIEKAKECWCIFDGDESEVMLERKRWWLFVERRRDARLCGCGWAVVLIW
eukprot:Phypoly_transcript_17819.p1 GENE.Phypoly_transcript_17819~~Phypoly_transcript_17819.p1  ORF type:complete len:132 (-),score=2.44 Phypoly_transcript_17819:225-620(-)